MKKKYTKKVIQYDIEGNILNTFNNPTEASSIVNYDSIINCCLGKYKTAGGFIFRFEGDKFKNNPNPSKLSQTHFCKICNSEETPRSMAMHLKWTHNLSNDEYITQYGEYRPKILNQQSKKKNSGIICKECGEKLNSNQHLMYHITQHHPEITKSEYVIQHIMDGITPLCKCGCGGEVTILENGNNCDLNKKTYHRDYIKGHWDWEVFTNIGKHSKEEIDLLNFIKTIYKGEIETNVRGIIPKSEIDIYLPNLNIGIEYNGLYWHSEKAGRMKDYHYNKFQLAQNQNIRLIQIFSDEWLNKPDIIKSKLISILSNPTNKTYARKCIVQEISPQEKNQFLNKHHIQGEDRSQVKLGLYYKEILVGVMTFSKPRISLGGKPKEGTYELSRYATSTNVIGGASKLLTYFKKTYSPSIIYSYSDNRWTDPNNNMYLTLGFHISNSSQPGYFYTKNFMNRIHRYNFNKYHLKKIGADTENKTESKIMKEMGYTRIWDCGTTKYELCLQY
jgi:hypothetical protein